MIILDKVKLKMTLIEKMSRMTPIIENMVENKLRWFEHLEKKPIDYVVRIVDEIERNQTTRGWEDLEKL